MRWPPRGEIEFEPAADKDGDIVVGSNFKLVFLAVIALTVAAIVGQILLAAIWTTPPPNEQTAIDGLAFIWKAGLGAILGLLGGKVT